MEKMVRKICLDTDASINLVTYAFRVAEMMDIIMDSMVFISSVTAFELQLRKTNTQPILDFFKDVYTLPFDETCAAEASSIQKNLAKRGKLVDFRDIFIAATAKANNCELLTFNKKHFENIRGLELVDF